MTTINDNSPFQPGVRVAVFRRHSIHSAIVDKVYKTGRFTLVGRPGSQYRPGQSGWGESREWYASETGDGYSRDQVSIWDAKVEERIREDKAKRRHETKLNAINSVFGHFGNSRQLPRELVSGIALQLAHHAICQVTDPVEVENGET